MFSNSTTILRIGKIVVHKCPLITTVRGFVPNQEVNGHSSRAGVTHPKQTNNKFLWHLSRDILMDHRRGGGMAAESWLYVCPIDKLPSMIWDSVGNEVQTDALV
ncbi:hypothetical protein E3N88_12064 [Mikania micrantha]|uniref:Uncharacterized protein n=1 Tax=Mikania micrantha TaxID=192012 RepID=A0A5N6P7F2_9ASTR|nr:hypothetical protein E3N88_12064 [Mikania micrantha]